MTIPHPMPIAVRLFEPISLLFPEANVMPSLLATVPAPSCVICNGPASPPSRMGWLATPDRVFVCCGNCADCADAELEAKITAKVSGEQRPQRQWPPNDQIQIPRTRPGRLRPNTLAPGNKPARPHRPRRGGYGLVSRAGECRPRR